jgi:hypothetical protein
LEGQYLVCCSTICIIEVTILMMMICQVLQSQMIGMQTSLDRILQAIQTNPNLAMPPPIYPPPPMAEGAAQLRQGFEGAAAGPSDRSRMFPPMSGFNPAV